MKSLLVLSMLVSAPLAAQYGGGQNHNQDLPRSIALGGSVHYGAPQNEFASNVNAAWGVNGFVGWRLGESPLYLRADLGYDNYGWRTRRVPLGGGALGLISVDVSTTNNIFNGGIGLQAGAPGPHLTPYAGGSIGFASFVTSSSVSGSDQFDNDPFASSTNYSDGTFAKTLYGGLYVPLTKNGLALDLGVRYHWNGEARYLTERDITFDANNDPVLRPRFSRADLLTFQIGVAYKRR
ncbi:MAG: hypothetical protein FJ363_05110 [Gemmatimonadetes bacterium]|nr:hypothetical protein [Gemmatimonadota bacterium]